MDVRWKPAPDRFSVGEVLAHLSHTEGHCYRMRLDRFLSEDNPEFEATTRNTTWSCTATWIPRMPSTISKSSARPTSSPCATCRRAPAIARAVHQKVGPITLAQMLNEWALHDLGHIRQIAELVRARKYLAGAGPLATFYQLKP